MNRKMINRVLVMIALGLACIAGANAAQMGASDPNRPLSAHAQQQRSSGVVSNDIWGGEKYGNPPPWIVSLQINFENKSTGYCTGELVSDEYVLTARHCLVNKNDMIDNNLSILAVFSQRGDKIFNDANACRSGKNVKIIEFPQNHEDPKDLALVKVKCSDGPDSESRTNDIPMYHGYSYKKEVLATIMGYAPPNSDSGLSRIVRRASTFINDLARPSGKMVYAKPSAEGAVPPMGQPRPGDSGGPMLTDVLDQSRIMAIQHSLLPSIGQELSSSDDQSLYTILDNDVFKWMSNKTGSTFISSPIDGATFASNQDVIKVKGYGPTPARGVAIFDDNGKMHGPLVTCISMVSDDDLTVNAKWGCEDISAPKARGRYTIEVMHRNNRIEDSVRIEVVPEGKSVAITYPPKPGIDSGTFVYRLGDFGQSEPYYVEGTGNSGDTLKFKLAYPAEQHAGENSAPCTNEPVQVDQYNKWRCQLEAESAGDYRLTVQIEDNRSAEGVAADERPNQTDTVPYQIIRKSISDLVIDSPKQDEKVERILQVRGKAEPSATVRIYDSKAGINCVARASDSGEWICPGEYALPEGNEDYEMRGEMYINATSVEGDDQPASSLIVNYRSGAVFSMTSPKPSEDGSRVDEIKTGDSFEFNGTGYSNGQVDVELLDEPAERKETNCRSPVTDGKWQCAILNILAGAKEGCKCRVVATITTRDDNGGKHSASVLGYLNVKLSSGISIVNPRNGSAVEDQGFAFKGTSSPGSDVAVSIKPGDSTGVSSGAASGLASVNCQNVTTDANGNWDCGVQPTPADGTYTLTAVERINSEEVASTANDIYVYKPDDPDDPDDDSEFKVLNYKEGDVVSLAPDDSFSIEGQISPAAAAAGSLVEGVLDGETVLASVGATKTLWKLVFGHHHHGGLAGLTINRRMNGTIVEAIPLTVNVPVSITSPTQDQAIAYGTAYDIRGQSNANDRMTVTDSSGNTVCTATANDSGDWACTPGQASITRAPGDVRITATPDRPELKTSRDYQVVPVPVSISSPAPGETVQSLPFGISGTGQPLATVTLTGLTTGTDCTTTVGRDGQWSCGSYGPADGYYTVVAEEWLNGNRVSEAGREFTVQTNGIALRVRILSPIQGHDYLDYGRPWLTLDATGRATPNSSVMVTLNGFVQDDALKVDASGNWRYPDLGFDEHCGYGPSDPVENTLSVDYANATGGTGNSGDTVTFSVTCLPYGLRDRQPSASPAGTR